VNRLFRLALLAAGFVAGYFAVRGVLAWRAERKARNVFPAKEAGALLNPLRSLIMPAGKTVRRYGISQGETVLELGPGPGWYSREASRAVGESGRLICLDIQRDMLDILRRRLDEDGCEADLLVGDAVSLPLCDSSVDCAYLVTVLGEVPDHRAAVGELARVTKPGGRVCFTESFGDPDYVPARAIRRMAADAALREDVFYRDPLGYTAVFRVEQA
jgi:ubiquinone/menaquinone biosynthesis C-methylase UbiE